MRRPIGTTIKRTLVGQASLSSRTTAGITNCLFQFSIPLLDGSLISPAIRTSRPGKNTGLVPCDVPTATPLAPCRNPPNY